MRLVVQRVTRASVSVDGEVVGAIGPGLCVLIGVTHTDTDADADRLADKLWGLRILEGERSAADVGAPLLVISQFTLYADCRKGRRPSFTDAGNPDWARPMFDYFVKMVDESCAVSVSSGIFGADMAVRLCNWGPVTIWLDSANLFAS